jgi:hypothetical protein
MCALSHIEMCRTRTLTPVPFATFAESLGELSGKDL